LLKVLYTTKADMV